MAKTSKPPIKFKLNDGALQLMMIEQILRNQRTAFYMIARTCGQNVEMYDAYMERVDETDELLKQLEK